MQDQGGGVDAITKSGRCRAVFENMAEMAIAFTAQHFCSAHKKKRVLFGGDTFWAERLKITRPAGAGIKFGDRGKKGCIATGAMVVAPLMAVPVFAREGPLGALLPAYLKLFFGQDFPPLVFGFSYFLRQGCHPLNIVVRFYPRSIF